VLQCVAVCCSVLHCVAARCRVLQCVAVCCSILQPYQKLDQRICAVESRGGRSRGPFALQCVAVHSSVCCSVFHLLHNLL